MYVFGSANCSYQTGRRKINMKCRLIVIGKAFKYILKKCNNLIRIDTQLQDMLTYYLHVRKCISKL